MSDHVVELTDNNFAAGISKGITLVDFWAPWCGPCRMQSPIIDQVAKVNVDAAPAVAAQHGVQSIPTMIVFKDGQPLQQFVGVRSGADLLNAIDQAQN